MKKGFKNLVVAGMVGLASMGLMTGCGKSDDKPYIKVQGLETGYLVGQTLNLQDSKILYYTSKNDTTADEIDLESSMIANFNTETEGNKKMKIFWNNCELEVEYSVMTKENLMDQIYDAYNNMLDEDNFHMEIMSSGHTIYKQSINVANNKLYAKETMLDNQEYLIYNEDWIEQYNGVWYYYLKNSELSIRRVVNSIKENNVMEYAASNVFPFIYDENMDLVQNINYEIENNQIVFSFDVIDDDPQDLYSYNYYLENGKFVKVEMSSYENGELKYAINSTIISNNAEDVEMVDLPGDIVWEDR